MDVKQVKGEVVKLDDVHRLLKDKYSKNGQECKWV